MNINPSAKRVLMYGDSLTFGKIPGGLRYPVSERIGGILQKELGSDYEIIEEGLRGRMLYGENKFFKDRNGYKQFGPIFGSHLPVDLLILFLGTNDINSGGKYNTSELASFYKMYLDKINLWCEQLGFQRPQVLIIAPPSIDEENSYKLFGDFFRDSKAKSIELPKVLEKFAQKSNVHFLDSSKIVKPSEIDGIHLSTESNDKIAKGLKAIITNILP